MIFYPYQVPTGQIETNSITFDAPPFFNHLGRLVSEALANGNLVQKNYETEQFPNQFFRQKEFDLKNIDLPAKSPMILELK